MTRTLTLTRPPFSERGCLLIGGLALFALYLGTATFDQQQSIDTLSTLVPAWQLASHGNVYTDSYSGFTDWFVSYREHVISNRLPGAILWAVPFYFLLGRGGTYAGIFPAAVASATAATLTGVCLYLALRRIAPREVAFGASAVFCLATPTWAVSADALWTHGPAQLFVSFSLLCYARQRYAAGGLSQGASILVRPHLAVVPAVMGLAESLAKRRIRPALVVGVSSILGLAGLVLYYRFVYGIWTVSGGYGALGGYGATPGLSSVSERMDYSSSIFPTVIAALVSPGRGLITYTPFVLFLVPGLPRAWKNGPVWVKSAAVAGIVYALVQLWNNGYSGEDFFAYRFMLEPLTLLTPILAIAYQAWTAHHRLMTIGFWMSVFASAAFEATASITSLNYDGTLDVWHDTLYDDVARAHPAVLAILLALAACGSYLVTFRVRMSSRRAAGPASPPGGSIATETPPRHDQRHPFADVSRDPRATARE